MAYFRTKEGIKLYYEFFPKRNRPVLVFIHGLGSDHSSWDRYVQHFRKKYATVTLDLRGYGLSEKPSEKEKYQLHCFVDDVAQLLSSLKIKDYFLIGHSLGGIIVSEYSSRNNLKPQGIILIATPLNSNDVTRRFKIQIRSAQVFPKGLYKLLDNSKGYAEVKNSFLFKIKCLARNNLKKSSLFILDNLHDFSIARKIKSPCLILLSDKDEIIKNKIKDLDPKVKFISGGHLAFIFTPEKVFPLIEGFVEKRKMKR